MKLKTKPDTKRIVFTLSMLLLCAVGFVRAVGDGDWWNLAVNCVGFCLFPVIVYRYGFKSFLKIPYLVWLLITVPTGAFFIHKYYYAALHRMAFAALVIEGIVYGLVIIRLIYALVKKELTEELKKFNPLFYVTLLFFIACIISVNKAVWPVYYGIFFISFYLAPSEKEDYEKLFVSVCDALIVSFFLVQSFAFLHRPFDQLRYVGAFTNSNVNAMFYFCVYMGWLGKLLYLRKIKAKKLIFIPHFLFAAAMWSFVILTVSRTTIVAFILVTLLYYIAGEVLLFKTKFVKGFLLGGLTMFVAFAVSFPAAYACVRYIPALRHHPIWITEYSEDFVHSYDPWNSEKYVEIDEFFLSFIGRFDPENVDDRGTVITEEVIMEEHKSSPDSVNEPKEEEEELLEYIVIDGEVIQYPDNVHPGTDKQHPAFEYEKYKGLEKILGIRKYIFWYYSKNLNFKGHEEEYPSAYILEWYMVPHAHNSYLQIAYCFGIIQGLIFTGISLFAIVCPFIIALKKKDENNWFYLLVSIIHFGIFLISLTENIAFPGKMMFSLFFLTLLPLMKKEKKSRE